MAKLATGALTPSKDPFEAYWIEDYKGIALVNKFLKDQHGFNTRFMVDAHFNDLVRYRLQGEAFALRAWFQWDLLRRYGGIHYYGYNYAAYSHSTVQLILVQHPGAPKNLLPIICRKDKDPENPHRMCSS